MNYLFLKRVFLSISISLLYLPCNAQVADSASNMLSEVVVSGIRPSLQSETSVDIHTISIAQIQQLGAYNISDALAKLPGISQLNTGIGISKPVIRGLYGNRIMVLLSGLRFDNQQWQDEHGLGLSDIGIDRIEYIKGPMSILYGSDAVGGIINIIEEKPADVGTKEGEVNARMYSNTLGLLLDAGFKGNNAKIFWRLHAGVNSNADYKDGNNDRVLNSRFGGYYLKGSVGFKKNNWLSINNYNTSLDNFGFITFDNYDSKVVDNRFSRSMDGPHHTVYLNSASSENTISLRNSLLKLNGGLQTNLRLEDEGGSKISLEMLLSSFIYNAQLIKSLNVSTQYILSNYGAFENNTNFGSRKIIPDANMFEDGVSAFIKYNRNKFILEAGAGFSIKNIHTFLTPGVNSPERDIQPFNNIYPAVNGSVGITYKPCKSFLIKVNSGTGFRAPNLAELSSNGLHEGTLRWEIGDPNMDIEQNINTGAEIELNTKIISFDISVFNNYFFNYIYLTPTGEKYLGFDIYRYKQYGADLYGGEASITILPIKYLEINSSFSTVTGALADDTYLPFIPANTVDNNVKLLFYGHSKITSWYVSGGVEYTFAQDHPAQFETETDAYTLIHASAGIEIKTEERTIHFSVTGNNLTNVYYFDHLSRYKEYGIHNPGRNIILNVNIPFTIHNK